METVYFLLEKSDSPRVKIGKSRNTITRTKQNQTGNSNDLEVICEIVGEVGFEKTLHERFSKYRVRGEWFELSDDIKKFITANNPIDSKEEEINPTLEKAEFLYTKDLSKFTFRNNRKIDYSRVASLAESISKNNWLHTDPIKVNLNYEVLDGQHRLEAARKIGVGIWYTIATGLDVKDVAEMNRNTRQWQWRDYIDYYAAEGKYHYEYLKNFIEANPEVPLNVCVDFSWYGAWNREKLREELLDGSYIFKNRDDAEKLAKIYKDLKKYLTKSGGALAGVVVKLYCLEQYDHSRMIKQISRCSHKLKRCGTSDEYIAMLQDIYNDGYQKNRVWLREP